MIKTRALNFETLYLILIPTSGAFFAAGRLLIDLMFGWDYSWVDDLAAGALFGLLFGAVGAFQMRRTEGLITFEGNADAFQEVATKTLSALGYQVGSKDSALVASKPPSSKMQLLVYEIHLQIGEGQAVLEGPWIILRKLKPTIETTTTVVESLNSSM
jgi:hypothetical protein